MVFTKTSSAGANAKKKKRFAPEGVSRARVYRQAKKRKAEDADQKQAVNQILSRWRKNVLSGGCNNALSYSSVESLVNKLVKQGGTISAGKGCAFLDIGSGCGLPCIYVALRYDVPCIGVERDAALVELAKDYATKAGVGHLCTFICQDVKNARSDMVCRAQGQPCALF